jgi:hypothetical protein
MKKIGLMLVAALFAALGALPQQAAASPYEQHRLPDGTLTGPISPHANGG